jgi:superfamily II DNA/RNA helicase
MESTKE